MGLSGIWKTVCFGALNKSFVVNVKAEDRCLGQTCKNSSQDHMKQPTGTCFYPFWPFFHPKLTTPKRQNYELRNYKWQSHEIWHKGSLWQEIKENVLVYNLAHRSRSQRHSKRSKNEKNRKWSPFLGLNLCNLTKLTRLTLCGHQICEMTMIVFCVLVCGVCIWSYYILPFFVIWRKFDCTGIYHFFWTEAAFWEL